MNQILKNNKENYKNKPEKTRNKISIPIFAIMLPILIMEKHIAL